MTTQMLKETGIVSLLGTFNFWLLSMLVRQVTTAAGIAITFVCFFAAGMIYHMWLKKDKGPKKARR